MRVEKVIEELVEVILIQEKEINELRKKIEQVKQYIDVYEDYIQRGDY